jgi:preprotein translocase subunit YajC
MSSSVPASLSAPTGSEAVKAIGAKGASVSPSSTTVGVATSPLGLPSSSLWMGVDWMQMGLPIVFMLAIYWLVIRPNNKKIEEQKQMVETLKVGDEVVAASGLMGLVHELKESHVMLKVADTLVLMVQRQSIQHVLPKGTVKFTVLGKHGR